MESYTFHNFINSTGGRLTTLTIVAGMIPAVILFVDDGYESIAVFEVNDRTVIEILDPNSCDVGRPVLFQVLLRDAETLGPVVWTSAACGSRFHEQQFQLIRVDHLCGVTCNRSGTTELMMAYDMDRHVVFPDGDWGDSIPPAVVSRLMGGADTTP